MVTKQNTKKKHIVTSFHNLAAELQDAVKAQYPLGFTDAMLRVDKPNGDFFYAVPFDTEEVAYLVKIDVKIDDGGQDDNDNDYYDEDLKGADELSNSDDDASADGGRTDDELDI